LILGVMVLLLAGAARAQAPEAAPRVYRCGDSYGTTPCPGGKPVAVDDSRSDEQRRQAQAVKAQDAQMASELAAERQARERAAVGQRAARLGPSEAERAKADALAAREKAKAERELKKKKKPKRTPHAAKPA
jgi:hypothetical protein